MGALMEALELSMDERDLLTEDDASPGYAVIWLPSPAATYQTPDFGHTDAQSWFNPDAFSKDARVRFHSKSRDD